MKRILCWLLGHQPRGPVNSEEFRNIEDALYGIHPVLYSCDRCKEIIYFDVEKGWLYYD